MIERFKLPEPFYYASGDGIFRSDGPLGKRYKFARFGKIFSLARISQAWQLCIPTAEEEEILRKDFYSLEKSLLQKKNPTLSTL